MTPLNSPSTLLSRDQEGAALHTMPETRPPVSGIGLDSQNRCAHYSSALDIISIKMRCCGIYYACEDCHEALAGHR